MLAVNLRAPVMLARLLGEEMAARRSGQIVFVSSLQGKAPSPLSSVYTATKFGLRGFSLSLRLDMADHGVGVSCVSPGFVSDAGMFADSGAPLPRGGADRAARGGRGGDRARDRAQPRRGRRRPAGAARRRAVRGARAGVRGEREQALRQLDRARGGAGPRGAARRRRAASGRRAPSRPSAGDDERPAAPSRPRATSASGSGAVTAVDTRPRGVALLVANPRRALVATVLAGGAISVQSYLNGRLGADAGSPTIGAAINNLVAFVVTRRDRARDPRAAARARPAARDSAGRRSGTSSADSAARRSCSSPPRRRPRSAWRCSPSRSSAGSTGGSLPVDAAGLGPGGAAPDHAAARRRRAAGDRRDGDQRARRAGRPGRAAAHARVRGRARAHAAGGGERAARARDGRAVGGHAGQRGGRLHRARAGRGGDARDVDARSRCRATRCSTPAGCSACSWSFVTATAVADARRAAARARDGRGADGGRARRRPDRAGAAARR